MLRVFVITNDYYLWCLSPFSFLFNKYWGDEQEVVIAGFHSPNYALPNNFRFHSISRMNFPQNKWSDGLISFLSSVQDDFSVIMLEDYWITRPVDRDLVKLAHAY